MNTKKKVNQVLTRNLVISSIIWASVIIASSFISGDSRKQITYILIAGYFVEFLRITSSNKFLNIIFTEKETKID